jgi:AcrR family transcriptional regulator
MSTRKLIIQAATRLFAEKGYEGMTMKDIANEVGIKAPSLYSFFKNKGDILLQLYTETISDHYQIAIASLQADQHQSVEKQLYDFLESIIDYHLRESIALKIFIRLLLFPPEVFEVNLREKLVEMENDEVELLGDVFKKGMASGEVRQGDARAMAKLLACMMDGWIWLMQRHDEATLRERFQSDWRQFWQGVKQLQ